MMNNAIFNVGVRSDKSDYVNEKIKTTNFLCVFFALLSVPFLIITYRLIPSLAYLTVLFFALGLVGVFFNYLDLNNVSRFIACFGFEAIYVVYSGSINPDDQPLIGSLLVMQVLFLLPPWILFDLEEKFLLIFYTFLAISLVTFMPYFNRLFSHEVDSETVALFTSGWMFYVCLITGVLGMSGGVLYLEVSTFQKGKKNTQLIQEMSKKANEIADNEKKLNDYIAEIEAAKKEDEKRQWASNGIAKFSDILRTQYTNSQLMFDSIISNLVKYVGANQGGLFLMEGEKGEEQLRLVALYAYERKKYLAKTVALGEGVLGQSALEKSLVYLKEIPMNYVTITSGLGGAVPRSLVVVPLLLNDEVYGVIELASFKEFEGFEREFIQRIGESIASTVSTVRINDRTKTLLEELQQQTEEMKSQEEEMRQNMEELVATQEEMQRKEREYIQRIEELEQRAGVF
jgi:putative methionine-R-sulfoxide reductase with GAF domain